MYYFSINKLKLICFLILQALLLWHLVYAEVHARYYSHGILRIFLLGEKDGAVSVS